MKCSNCGEKLNDGAKFCPNCGTEVGSEDNKNICPQCGAEIKLGAKFCSECGVALPVKEKEEEQPKENTDEAGKKAWEDLKNAVREKYEIDEEDEDSVTINFSLEDDITYPLLLIKEENYYKSEIWLEIASPIGGLNSLDLEEVCELVGDRICGGIAMTEDLFILRTCILMSKIDKDAVFRTMRVICSTACELNAKYVDEEDDDEE